MLSLDASQTDSCWTGHFQTTWRLFVLDQIIIILASSVVAYSTLMCCCEWWNTAQDCCVCVCACVRARARVCVCVCAFNVNIVKQTNIFLCLYFSLNPIHGLTTMTNFNYLFITNQACDNNYIGSMYDTQSFYRLLSWFVVFLYV
jgi:hypothetical protein